ncbi:MULTISPECIES: GNAT family N-acetyltransferase [Actinomadura]|uniref:GNAT family N-acetyltransferase n=1 Tax=Actinomadura yumaensis TaxID=111807 RepID=A0ABW2CW61_9ACTN|nr:GNAT family N-acetyltransferase [Actinomadura sp. J1-007]MWK40602.1 GNAT family N-acetyltransferase [Actinomadura sp. J1-007]
MISDLLGAYDGQLRGEPAPVVPGVFYERDGPVVRIVGERRGLVTGPRDLGVEGPDLDALIVRQRDYFAARGEAVEWKTRAHDTPADLTGRLARAGFATEDTETVMIARVADGAAAAPAGPPAGVAFREVNAVTDLRRIADMEAEVWGADMGWLADDLAARVAAAPDGLVVLAAEADGRIVASGWLVFRPGTEFASLWGGSTLAAWRGRGIYRALVAERFRLAAERGVRYLQVDASDASRPILARLGFHPVTTTTPYVWTPS